jgi:hypothetical protein
MMQEGALSPGVSKILNGALWVVIVLSAVAIFSLIISEIRNLFK